MAGHRKQHGRPARSQLAIHRAAEQMAVAETPEARLAAAFDWFRLAVAAARKRDGQAAAAALAREGADWLAHRARTSEGTRA